MYIAYRASASAAFAIEAAGIVGHFVHISGICSLSFNALKGKVRAPYRWVIIIHHIVASATVMPYMMELPVIIICSIHGITLNTRYVYSTPPTRCEWTHTHHTAQTMAAIVLDLITAVLLRNHGYTVKLQRIHQVEFLRPTQSSSLPCLAFSDPRVFISTLHTVWNTCES